MKKNLYSNIICFLIALPGLFLLINRYQYFAISSFLLIFILGLIFLLCKKSITQYHFDILFILSIIYIYFTLSYFISNQTINDYFSYSFLRYDGNFFFNYLPFFALAIPYFNYRKVTNIFFKFIFFTFTFASIIGLIEYFTKKFNLFFSIQNSEEVLMVMNNTHNATGSVYAVVCIFLLAFFLLENKKYVKIIYFLALFICLTGLLLTRSRGSYIGFVFGVVIVLWLYYRSVVKFFITMILMIAASIPIIFFTGVFDRIKMIFNFSEPNVVVLFLLWERAWHLLNRSPIFGVGFGRYNDIYYISRSETIPSPDLFIGYPNIAAFYMEPAYRFGFGHAHNGYFQFLAETGIIGLGLLLFFWILCYRKILKGYNLTRDGFSKKVFLSSLGGIASLFALSLTENYFSATTVMICLSMVVSLAIGLFWQESLKDDYKKISN